MDFTKIYYDTSDSSTLLTRDLYLNSNDVVLSIGKYVTFSKFESFSGTRHPGYFERKKRGEVILGDSVHIISSSSAGGASYTNRQVNPPPTQTGQWVGKSFEGGGSVTQYLNSLYPALYPSLSTKSLATLGDEAKLKAMAGVTKPEARMMEDLLSIRQNIKFLKDPLRDLEKATTDFLKKRNAIVRNIGLPRRDPRILKLLSDLYLGYRFAVTPTVKSISDLLDNALKHHDGFSKDILLRASGVSSSSDGGYRNSTILSRANYTVVENLTRKARAIVYYRLKSDVKGWSQVYGVRPKDLPAGVWACVPLSFMVDRVANVTDYLNALVNIADPNILMEGGCLVSTEISSKQMQLTSMVNTTAITYTGGGDVWTRSYMIKSKTTFLPGFATLPRPPISLGGLVKDAKSIADLAALVYQRTRQL